MTLLRTVTAPGTPFVGLLFDRLELLAAVASPAGQRGAVLLGLDADHVVVALGAGRLADLAPRLAAVAWLRALVVGNDNEGEEIPSDTLLAVLEALYDAHSSAARLSYVPASLAYDPKAALALIDGVARLHHGCRPRGPRRP